VKVKLENKKCLTVTEESLSDSLHVEMFDGNDENIHGEEKVPGHLNNF